jgi:hypothetical protein
MPAGVTAEIYPASDVIRPWPPNNVEESCAGADKQVARGVHERKVETAPFPQIFPALLMDLRTTPNGLRSEDDLSPPCPSKTMVFRHLPRSSTNCPLTLERLLRHLVVCARRSGRQLQADQRA